MTSSPTGRKRSKLYARIYAQALFLSKQKTAYEISPRDWGSDVCSSDLDDPLAGVVAGDVHERRALFEDAREEARAGLVQRGVDELLRGAHLVAHGLEDGEVEDGKLARQRVARVIVHERAQVRAPRAGAGGV